MILLVGLALRAGPVVVSTVQPATPRVAFAVARLTDCRIAGNW